MQSEKASEKAIVIFEYNGKTVKLQIEPQKPCNYVAGGLNELSAKLGLTHSCEELYIELPNGQLGDLVDTELPTKAREQYDRVKIHVRQRILVGPQTQIDEQLVKMVPKGNVSAYYMPRDKEQLFKIYGGKYQDKLKQLFKEELQGEANDTPVLVMPGASVGHNGNALGYDQVTQCPVLILQENNCLNIWVPPLEHEDVFLSYPKGKNFKTLPITYQNGIVLFTQNDFKVAMAFPGDPKQFPFGYDTKSFKQLVKNLYKGGAQNISNQMTQTIQQVSPIKVNNTTTPAAPKINIIVKYNGTYVMPGFNPNTPISELIMQIRNKFKNENVDVIYCDEYGNQKKLDANDNRPLSSVFNQNPVTLTVYDKQNVVGQPQTTLNSAQQNLNNNQTNQNYTPALFRYNFNNGLEANGTATVNKQPVQVRVPMVKTVPVKRPAPVPVKRLMLRPAQPPVVRPTVVPVRPFVPVVPVRTNQSVVPKFVPVKAQTTFRPLQVVPRPVTAPPQPPVVRPSQVGPVPQSGDGRPELNTYYVLQGYTKNMNTQVTNWSPQPTQRIPMDYQTYINQNIHGAQYLQPQWSPKYQYCDELGMIFESDSPIYKDARNNLVTLGNARYRTP